jgi:DNA-binding response OmpR family regulator
VSAAAVDVLIVEDDARLAELTATYLSQNGFSVAVESRGDRALERFTATRPRLVLLDLMLPGIDGFAVCRAVRELAATPILMLTARDADLDQIVGLEAGADDYVNKPVDPLVLLARIRALLRRGDAAALPTSSGDAAAPGPAAAARARAPDIVLGTLRISAAARSVTLHGRPIDLTTQEFELLALLGQRAGQLVSREDVFRVIRGIDYDGVDRSIDGRISRLRRKLEDDAQAPTRIKTVWGKGYLLAPDAWGDDAPKGGPA